MSDKVKKIMYWATILPPVFKAIKAVFVYAYDVYMNTLMQVEQKKMEDKFNNSWKETKK